MARSLREKIHNPFNWVCNCDPTCWCNTRRWGRTLRWYIPPRFHRFPPKRHVHSFMYQDAQFADAQPAPPASARRGSARARLITRIRGEHAKGESLGEIARRLNTDRVPTSRGGRRWWPSTVRAVLARSSPPAPDEAGNVSDRTRR